jgi:DNA-binding MarR family transcriptional regulator
MRKYTSNILLSIVDEVLRLQSCFENVFSDLNSLSNLSTLQKLVLSAVLDSPVPPTVPQIGRNLGRPRQVIQRIANELMKDGLIEKMPNPHHRRASLLAPTAGALLLARQAEQRAAKATRALLDQFDVEKCSALTVGLRDLREAIEAVTPADQARERAMPDRLTVTGALALI